MRSRGEHAGAGAGSEGLRDRAAPSPAALSGAEGRGVTWRAQGRCLNPNPLPQMSVQSGGGQPGIQGVRVRFPDLPRANR